MKVVYDVAAAEYQHPAAAQRFELRPQLEVIVQRLLRVDRELHHRDVRRRKRVHQHRPSTVVDAPAVLVEAHPRGLDQVGYFLCHLG